MSSAGRLKTRLDRKTMPKNKLDLAEIAGPQKHLIERANLLLKSYNNPSDFLGFLTDAIEWIDCYLTKDVHLKFR